MRRKAISPAITSIFLIGVAVVGAASAGNAMFRQNELSMQSAKLDITNMDLIRLDTSKIYLAGTIQNTGTVTFSNVSVSIVENSGHFHRVFNFESLEPSAQVSDYSIMDMEIETNSDMLVLVEGITPAGSTFKIAKTVTVRG